MRWQFTCLIVVLGAVFGLATGLAQAQSQRLALVIGNSAYQQLAPLANPAADAAALGERLSALGFETHVHTDLTMRGMVDALKAFRLAARGADFALVYYAGHGRQAACEGCAVQNYLFPVDARPDEAIDLAREAMTINEVFSTYLEEAGAGKSLVLLDAGRTLDLWGQSTPLEQHALADRRFAAVRPHTDDWFDYEIWYASEADTEADDGPAGASSPFAAALLAALKEPGLDTDALFRRVAAHMREASGPRQRPTPYGRLSAPVVIHTALPVADLPAVESIPDFAAASPDAEDLASVPEAATPVEDEPAEAHASAASAVEPSFGSVPLDEPALAAFPDMFEPAADRPTDEQLDALLAWSSHQFEAGQYEGAVTALEQALQYEPDNLGSWLALSNALFAQGDYQRAMEAFRQRATLGLEPRDLIGVGDALLLSANRHQAAMNFLMALTLAEASGDAEAANLAHARIESIAAAVALEAAKEQAGERLAAAWAAVDAGRYADAELTHAEILSNWPEMAGTPELSMLAAEIAYRLGRTQEAETLYRLAAEIDAGGSIGVRAEQSLAAVREERESERVALARADQIPLAALQWAMKALGHYTGPIDGNFGPTSQTAAQAFQDRIGSEQTGELTNEQRVLAVTMAAEAGQAESQNTLGIMYATGVGVRADVDRARLWWERAAAQGFTKAEDNLARFER